MGLLEVEIDMEMELKMETEMELEMKIDTETENYVPKRPVLVNPPSHPYHRFALQPSLPISSYAPHRSAEAPRMAPHHGISIHLCVRRLVTT